MFGRVDDEELVRRALGGSERAWLTLVKRHERRLYNYALRMSGNPDDAMDILQDVLMSMYRNLRSFRGDSQFTTWLFRIAAFRSTDFFRRRRVHDGEIESLADDHPSASPETNVSDARTATDIQRLLADLPAEQRQVIELKYFQHFTFDEIAGQLGISPNTAKTRLYAALAKLRKAPDLQVAL